MSPAPVNQALGKEREEACQSAEPKWAASEGQRRLRGATAAGLEFFPTPTRTRIIAANRLGRALNRCFLESLFKRHGGRRRWSCLLRVGHSLIRKERRSSGLSGLQQVALDEVAGKGGQKLFKGLEISGAAEEVVEHFVFDVLHQLDEHGVGLGLVLGQRIFLTIGTEIDSFAQSIHRVEVLLPETVHGIQDDIFFQSAAGGCILDRCLAVVGFREGLGKKAAVGLDVAGSEGAFLGGEPDGEGGIDPLEESGHIGLGIAALGGEEGLDFLGHDFADDLMDEDARILGIHDLVAVAVDDFALLVHDIIKFQRPAAHEVVTLFDALLGGLDTLVEPGVLELLPLLHTEGLHDLGHAVGGTEVAHEVILEADIEPRATRISLSGAAAAKLAVNAAGLVAFRAKDEEAAQIGNTFPEFDVGAATGHVCRNGDGPAESGTGDNLGLLHVELGVQDGVRNPLPLEHPAQQLGGFDAGGADQDGLAAAVGGLDLVDGGGEFLAAGLVNTVVFIRAGNLAVGRDDVDVQTVDVMEFIGLGLRRAGHPGELLVEAEVILDGDRGHRLGLAINLDPFLGLNGLVKSVAPAASGHLASGEGVHDDDLVFLDDILDILFIEAVGLEKLGDVVHPLGGMIAMLLGCGFPGGLFGVTQRGIRIDVGELGQQVGEDKGVRIVGIEEGAAHLREVGFLLFFLDGEVEFFLEGDEGVLGGVLVKGELGLVGQPSELGILHGAEQALVAGLAELDLEEGHACGILLPFFQQFSGFDDEPVNQGGLLPDKLLDERLEAVELMRGNRRGAADDERGAGFVDQDGIDFIDDGEVMAALHLLLAAGRHAVVAEVVEAKLAVGAVGDVGLILGAAHLGGLVVLDDAGSEPQECVELAHALGIAPGEVVIDRDHMDAAAREGIQIDREGGDEGLALAGGHLGNAPLVEHDASDELHIEMHHVPGVIMIADDKLLPDHPAGGILHHRKGLGQDLLKTLLKECGILDLRKLGLPGGGLFTKGLFRKSLQADLDLIDFGDKRKQPAHLALVL